MNHLYFQVQNGCAGDMLVASLLDLGLPLVELERELRKFPVGGFRLQTKKVRRKTTFGHELPATALEIIPDGTWEDTNSYQKIVSVIQQSGLSQKQKERLSKIFNLLARAESAVHGEPLEKLHFHQVGQVDALVEMASVVIALDLLEVEEVGCSAIGVACPAPATVEMLRGLPAVVHGCPYELATPTGVAILCGLCPEPGQASRLKLKAAGYGAGQRLEPSPNVVQALLGSSETGNDEVGVIETNIDDLNPVLFDFLMERLFASGALDVSLFPGQAKKNRPVFNLQVIFPPERLEPVAHTIFSESTTLGLRFRLEKRLVLERRMQTVETSWGPVPVKLGFLKGRLVNLAPEYEV
ncbi:MAG TPA: LarC family nickel insertion protein, partial [bacterium]|nr:LarC family nickel insertion protein [bacterium]